MRRMIAVVAAALALFVLPSCTDGKHNPVTAASIVDAVEAPACAMLGIAVGDQAVGAVCEDVADVVGLILRKIKPSTVSSELSEVHYTSVSLNGRPIGYVRSDLAPVVQAELDQKTNEQ